MRLARCILSLTACAALALGLSVTTVKSAQAKCGDGVTTVGEACDNGTDVCIGGKNPGAECCSNADCTGGGTCGEGNGSARTGTSGNRDDVADACRCSCMPPSCGDGVSDAGEQCDPGSSTSLNTPCLGNAPNSVCSSVATPGMVLDNPNIAGATVKCANNADCAAVFAPGVAECKGNPQCHLNVCGDSEVCSDANCTSGSGALFGPKPGARGPEACDDGNLSDMDGCTSYNFSATIGSGFAGVQQVIADHCQSNVCGDGVTNMGVEQCDIGQALCETGVRTGKPCCTNADCKVGNIAGICSSSTGSGTPETPNNDDNGNQPNSECRCNCNVAFCGDGISDNNSALDPTIMTEQCDDGTTSNGPGKFCNKVRRCVGGENPGDLCTSDAGCTKGACGPVMCEENICGDGILAGNELCDDGNTVAADATNGDTCGLPGHADPANATLAAAFNAVLHPGCDTALTGALANQPNACTDPACLPPLCGDGVTNPSEMCDGGPCVCDATALNADSVCTKASDCKPGLGQPAGVDRCGLINPLTGGMCNRSDVADHCRPTCMPPICGDGTSDSGEACEPPASGTFCIKNAAGLCVLNTCGDDDVCNKSAKDSFGATHGCTTGPGGGNEQCDDSNTVDPNATNTDTCFTTCTATGCGDGVTEAGEQCDSTTMGCSNMQEDLSDPEIAPDCCIDGNVVSTDKATAPGLISVETAFHALLDCRMPNLVGAASCNAPLAKLYQRILNKELAAEVRFENNDVNGARRMLTQAFRQLDRMPRRIARLTKPGKACAGSSALITNQTANASDLTIGIVAQLTQNNPGFGH